MSTRKPSSAPPVKKPKVRFPTQGSAIRQLASRVEALQGANLDRLFARDAAVGRDVTVPSLEARVVATAAHHGLARPRPSEGPRLQPAELPDVEALGRVVRARRQILGLSQHDLADQARVGRRFVSDLEGGKPTVEFGRVLQVFEALGLSLTARDGHG